MILEARVELNGNMVIVFEVTEFSTREQAESYERKLKELYEKCFKAQGIPFEHELREDGVLKDE